MKNMQQSAIHLEKVEKKFCLYRRNIHRVIETIFPFGKQLHTPFYALKGVDLDVHQGETVGIIGRNGSGKSTMLQIICGILQPTEGEVQLGGRVSALLELGAGFNPEFNGRDNIYLSTSIMGMTKEETDSRLDEIIEFADIGEFIDQPVKMYSSGMFVRLAFATAISVNPDILIVDEALAVGDIFFQQKCMNHMKKMMESKTIVLVSHDMHAISNLCDRVLVMEGGEKIFDGSTLDGIALYTRLVHNELFQEKGAKVTGNDLIPDNITEKLTVSYGDYPYWPVVEEDARGGAGAVAILKVSLTKNGELFQTVEPGERVKLRMLVHAQKELPQTIFGYTIKDRVGVAIFGENSVVTLKTPPRLEAGYTVVSFEFIWPEVVAQEYTLTLGIGEGDHPFDHTIQCWAHNIFSFQATTPGLYLHGIFNNKIQQVTLDGL